MVTAELETGEEESGGPLLSSVCAPDCGPPLAARPLRFGAVLAGAVEVREVPQGLEVRLATPDVWRAQGIERRIRGLVVARVDAGSDSVRFPRLTTFARGREGLRPSAIPAVPRQRVVFSIT